MGFSVARNLVKCIGYFGEPPNGEYGFDFEVKDDVNYFPGDLPPDAKTARPEPKWVQKWLGPEYFHDIHVVFIDHQAHPKGSAQRRPPPNLAFLDPLGQLRQLRLSQCDLDEDRLAWIGSLPHLKYLVLRDEQITDKGLAKMARCTSLVKLDLNSNSITDSGVAEIGKLIRLKGLHIRSKGVQGLGLRSLSALQDLRELTLSCSSLGDEGLEFVPKLGHLEFLMLRGGQRVTDAGISHVSRSGTINWLCLYTPHLTDDALASIANLSTLEDLSVSGGAMTEIGIAKLAVVPRLMRLEFITNKVTDGIATAFSKLKALGLLVLYRAPLGPNALAILKAANPGLSIPD